MSCLNTPLERLEVLAKIDQMELTIARASDDNTTRRERLKRYLRVLSRQCRIKEIRAALSTINLLDPANSVELERYIAAGFNTVVVEDKLGDDGQRWIQKSDQQIASELAVARSRNLNVILSLYAWVYGDIPAMTGDQVADRFSRWVREDEGELVGVYFLGDDVFLQQAPVAKQIEWRAGLRTVTNAVPVFGMIGEFGVNASAEDVTNLFSRDAFDHLLFLMYPYNLGVHWGRGELDSRAVDPDEALHDYIDDYLEALNTKFFAGLRKRQLVIPVVQAFNYVGEAAGKLLRPDDVFIQMTYTSTRLREIVGTQDDNFSMTCFYWGGMETPYGLRENEEFVEAARRANFDLREYASCGTHDACIMAHEVFS